MKLLSREAKLVYTSIGAYDNFGVFIILQMPWDREEHFEFSPELGSAGPGLDTIALRTRHLSVASHRYRDKAHSSVWLLPSSPAPSPLAPCVSDGPLVICCTWLVLACTLPMPFPPWKCLLFLLSLLLVLQHCGHKFLSPLSLPVIPTIWIISVCAWSLSPLFVPRTPLK